MNDSINISPIDEEISLFDIWKKIVQYKKLFWVYFFIVFAVGAAVVLFTPAKYSFTQVIEMAMAPNEHGVNTVRSSVIDVVSRQVKDRFYPDAVRRYNLQTAQKINERDLVLKVKDVGNNAILLSVDGQLKDIDKYKFIFQEVLRALSDDTKKYIDSRIKNLSNQKANTEIRFTELKELYNDMIKSVFGNNVKKENINFSGSENGNKIILMYLRGQNSTLSQLDNDISVLQMQLADTHGAVAASDLIVSDEPVSPSKYVLLILAAIVALFFAFFGVFIADFMSGLKKHLK